MFTNLRHTKIPSVVYRELADWWKSAPGVGYDADVWLCGLWLRRGRVTGGRSLEWIWMSTFWGIGVVLRESDRAVRFYEMS